MSCDAGLSHTCLNLCLTSQFNRAGTALLQDDSYERGLAAITITLSFSSNGVTGSAQTGQSLGNLLEYHGVIDRCRHFPALAIGNTAHGAAQNLA